MRIRFLLDPRSAFGFKINIPDPQQNFVNRVLVSLRIIHIALPNTYSESFCF
jgi:hypothetical protein